MWKGSIRSVSRKGRRTYYTATIGRTKHYLGTDKKEAHRRLSAILARSGDAEAPESPAGLAAAWEDIGRMKQRAALAIWEEFCGDMNLEDLPRRHLTDFARHLQQKGYRPYTVQSYVADVKRALDWAYDQNWIDRQPSRVERGAVASPRVNPRPYTQDQIDAAFATLPKTQRHIVPFILATGCRPGEACKLEWQHVDIERRVCTLPAKMHKTGRHGTSRIIYLSAEAVAILESVPCRTGPCFRNRYGTAHSCTGIQYVLSRRGLPSVYRLRHTFAQRCLDAGMPLEELAVLLGHEGLGMVRHYAKIGAKRALAALDRMAAM